MKIPHCKDMTSSAWVVDFEFSNGKFMSLFNKHFF